MKIRKLLITIVFLTVLQLTSLAFAQPVFAQMDTGLNAVGQTVQLPDTDPRIIAARLINIVLGFLGVVLLVIILYAGFLWMTAGGDAAKVDKAKAWLRNGIIGVIIILFSWAIASFIINSLINAATGTGGGGGGSGGGGSGGGGFGPGGGDVFRVMAKSPEGSVGNANLIIRVLFNREVDDATLDAFSIAPQVSGSWQVDPGNPKRVIFTPTDPCPGAPQKTCFAFDTQYQVSITTDLRSIANQQLRCGGFYPSCDFTFTSGDTVDSQAPDINILNLYNGKSVPVDTAVEVLARAKDDIGVSGMEWEEGGQLFHSDGPLSSPSPQTFESSGFWDTVGKTPKQSYTINVLGTDLDTNTGSASVDVVVLAEHCFDNLQNYDETGMDCGGADCLACSGGACQTNSQCASGLCINGVCVEQPVITDVKPLSGDEGTYVSIWGDNFGDTGQVSFLGPPEVTASAPQACVAAGATTWSDNYVLVEVPQGAATGPIKLTNANSNLTDQTDDSLGPQFTFTLTDEQVPGLCAANPNQGEPGISVTLDGANLGSSAGTINFGNMSVAGQNWSDTSIDFLAPIVNPGLYPVWVAHENGLQSNKVPFTIESKDAPQPAPVITYVDPGQAPRGQMLSIVGERFGNNPGVVYFYDKAADKTYVGDSAFSEGCAQGWWKNNNIVIKVPSVDANVVKPAQFSIYIERSDSENSNQVDFTYTDGQAGPGLCTINPSAGPASSYVSLYGENLGQSSPGNEVVFTSGQSADIQAWQDNQIDVTVPNQAVTGPVFASISGVDTNSMQFAVADCRDDASVCDSGQTCCPNGTCADGECQAVSFKAQYSWQFSTGVVPKTPRVVEFCDVSGAGNQLPSPTPWQNHPGGDQVCIDPVPRIGVLFDIPINWPPEQSPNTLFSLQKCTGQGADPCDELEELSTTEPTMISGGDPYVSFEPTAALEPETTYYVFVSSEIRSEDLIYGTTMDENTNCPEPGLGYCYRFRTRSDTGPCEIGDVYVNPWKAYVEGNEEQEFEALPATKDAVCNLMKCEGFEFNWSADPLTKAWVKNSPTPNACSQTVVAGDSEAMNPPVSVSAQEDVSKITGLADLYIQFITPHVVDKFPDCDTACSNIYIWAQMNTSLWADPPPAGQNSVLIADPIKAGDYYQNVKVYECATENCLPEDLVEIPINVTLPETPPLLQYQNTPYSFIRIEPVQNLKRATYYHVRLNGGAGNPIKSKHGMPMNQSETWEFRTRLENEECQPDAVNITPTRRIEEKIGDRELFSAQVISAPDDCRADGQMLKTNQAFNWEFDDPNQQVASFLFSAIDTGASLPHGCSNNCLAKGSDGIFGQTALCGNGIVETVDDNFCQGGLAKTGQPCVLLPIESGAGEQCDGGGLCDPVTCLLKEVPGGNCGNNSVEYAEGEMCDPGTRCFDTTSTASGLEGQLCNTQQIFDDCYDAGGVCEVRDYNGCSAGCKNLGATSMPGTTCGNGDIAEGEDCDLGNQNGRGCSNNCLHTGSSPEVASICGNGILEAGENCEAPAAGSPVPAYCDNQRCVKLGSQACPDPSFPNCCGNNVLEDGEECDDGNNIAGDHCSPNCLLEGSSWKYVNPSFCGNGILETGELCESILHTTGLTVSGATAGEGDGLTDPIQLAVIEPGTGTPDPETQVMSTDLSCVYDQVDGAAVYGVGCGKTDESQCDSGFGLDENGCCAPRPALDENQAPFPQGDNSGQGFCRNILVEAYFEHPMDVQSVAGNFTIAQEISGTACPDGTEPLATLEEPKGFWNWIVYGWNTLITWISGTPTRAIYCTQSVPGNLSTKGTSTKAFVYRLSEVLEPNTRYIVRFEGDDDLLTADDDNIKQGIRTAVNVTAIADVGGEIANSNDWEFSWWFETGSDICRINTINIQDNGPIDPTVDYSPFYFDQAFEEHILQASAKSVQNGQAQAISPIPGLYNWQWEPWVINNPELAQTNDEQASYSQETTQSAVRVSDKSGYTWVFASLKITEDTLGNGNTKGSLVSASKPVTVFICEYPWPPRQGERFDPFRDADQSIVSNPNELWLSQLYDDLYATYPNGPFFNFQTMYCRDHENGLMPALNPSLIPLSQSDIDSGILRQYLFTFNVPAYKSDGIGIRVYRNPYMDTPLEWYRRQGFLGSPEQFEIDGYPAVRDGGTVYISFPNTTGIERNIYPNILVISHNIGASTITQEIFEQLVNNVAFNINFNFDNSNVCVKGGQTGVSQGEIYLNPAMAAPVTCVSDWDCLKIDNSPDDKLRCASFKYKLQHDIKRLADFKSIRKAMDDYYSANQRYPVLSEGTFQKSRTNSRWPSWQEQLGNQLGITMPLDPVNRLITCGLCKPVDNPATQSTVPCATDEDCNEGYFCEEQEGYNTQTCWNPEELQFKCPYMEADGSQPQTNYDPYGSEEPFAPSRFYKYRSFDAGRRYELAANFEVPPMSFVTDPQGNPLFAEKWWSAVNIGNVELKYCRTDNPISDGRWCTVDADCKPCLDPKAASCTEPAPVNSCQPAGFRYKFKNICNNDVMGISGICGDGIKGLVCAGGVNAGNQCADDSECPGSTCSAEEFCELGETKIQTCDYSAPGEADGFMLTVCEDCQRWAQDPILSVCRPKVACGNGRLDGLCGGNITDGACTSDADCEAGQTCEIQETCDDGVLNGTYGHCNLDCTGYDKYCGDGQLSPGEDCDAGSDPANGNGAYCADTAMCYGTTPLADTCGLGCTGKAPYCGDGKTNGPEQCDGEVLRTITAICSEGPYKEQPCVSNDDCGDYLCGPATGICDQNTGFQKLCRTDEDCPGTSCIINPIPNKKGLNYQSCEGFTQTRCATAASVCLSSAERKSLITGTLFANNPNIVSTYQACQTDSGCGDGQECVALNLGINCDTDAQCSNNISQGICRDYATEHIRRCKKPGVTNQCKWESTWSKCIIANYCGDGILNPGEECDDGFENGNNKACLPTCKLNVCGDGHLYTNVEECDHGVNNGKSVCQAQYGSTCNDCSLQCKILAKAGGYCGNGIKEPGEQCDGNIPVEPADYDPANYVLGSEVTTANANTIAVKGYIGEVCENPPCQIMAEGDNPTDLTCEQLGYDFALNSQLNRAIEITSSTAAKNYTCDDPSFKSCVLKAEKIINDVNNNRLLNQILIDCGLMGTESTTALHPVKNTNILTLESYWLPQNEWPSKTTFYRCVNQIGAQNGFRTVYESNDKPICTPDCKPGGCGRCSDEIGDATIHGYIMDRVWLQPVPSARVSLQYRNIVVDQKLTDENGRFEFNNLASRGECDKYKLTIDMFDNNICTEPVNERPADGCLPSIAHEFDMDIDEGERGGYWSFTTDEFSAESFPFQEMLGMIFIYPRPARGEGYLSYGRPTLLDSQGWQKLKACKENPNSPGCQDQIVNLWFPWDKMWTPHVIWPNNQARLARNMLNSGVGGGDLYQTTVDQFGGDLCSYTNRGTDQVHAENSAQRLTCARDYNWLNQGVLNLRQAPHTALICPTLKWDRAKNNNCPLIGVNACMDNCTQGLGIWKLFAEWDLNLQPNCQNFCNPKDVCSQSPLVQPMDLSRCHLEIHNAQATALFRYADPNDLDSPISGLDKPIEFYFAAPGYEPFMKESFFTAPLSDTEVEAWVAGNKPQAYASIDEYPNKILSWREYWAKTATQIYLATADTIQTFQSQDNISTREDFKKPFWHMASVSPQGQVTVHNDWQGAADLDYSQNVLGGYLLPNTADEYNNAQTAIRPEGMACWNNFGASCKYIDDEPAKHICTGPFEPGVKDIISIFDNNTKLKDSERQEFCATFWSVYGISGADHRKIYNNYPEYIQRFNVINW